MPPRASVLIVDDDPATLAALPTTLSIHLPDVSVSTCVSGILGLERLRAMDFGVILADLRMPGMDGLTFLHKVHEVLFKQEFIGLSALNFDKSILLEVDEHTFSGHYDEVCSLFLRQWNHRQGQFQKIMAMQKEMGLKVDSQGDLMSKSGVDGVYSADPRTHPDAIRYDELTFQDALRLGLKVVDAAAFALCMENHLPMIVFGMEDEGSIARALQGEKIGTLVHAGPDGSSEQEETP